MMECAMNRVHQCINFDGRYLTGIVFKSNFIVMFLGLPSHISMRTIQLHIPQPDTKMPVWFTLEHMRHAPLTGRFSQSTSNLTGNMVSFKYLIEALSNCNVTVILFLLSHVLIFTWANNESLFLTI